tara:strand:- start:340 stop:984 length:645 start_codon:yes stop_codon:yes gene_type:complete
MTDLNDLVSAYQDAVDNKDWDRDFSDIIDNLEGHVKGKKLQLKNEFLKNIGIDYQHYNSRNVGLLLSHVHNLLYLQSLGFTELNEMIKSEPQILSLSLDKHIKPRYAFLQSKGIKNDEYFGWYGFVEFIIEPTDRCFPSMISDLNVARKIKEPTSPYDGIICETCSEATFQQVDNFEYLGVGNGEEGNVCEQITGSHYTEWMTFKANYIKNNKR